MTADQARAAAVGDTVGVGWTVHEAREGDDAELLALFQEVFGHEMPAQQWAWKYAGTPVRGILLRRDGAVVAFFGAMPREVQGPDRIYHAVQNGDVMVKPGDRAVFTKRGAFYYVSTAFTRNYLGPGRKFDFGIGFPNQRHLDLGVKLGIYIEGERLMTLSWSPLHEAADWWTRETRLQAGHMKAVDSLWKMMCRDWHGLFIPLRDANRWRYRYLDHPTCTYHLLLVRRRLGGRPLAALALREHPGHIEWLDYVGPQAQVARAVGAARRFAGAHGDKPLTALCSQSLVPVFGADAAAIEPSTIGIPLTAPEPGWPQPYPWQGKLWLMGGDTDFL